MSAPSETLSSSSCISESAINSTSSSSECSSLANLASASVPFLFNLHSEA
ncbi:hypothetical protein Lalb_Chr11g0073611 [Lupinus albus]|uniref:Uncharacterized protein n=1 Tax=Lupinus albus TaxID=3870 RepID=A0A6A4PST5_LUPAL|nr:hypothetical protein Lalb_Chr11g0073611 [Lupinus albus]